MLNRRIILLVIICLMFCYASCSDIAEEEPIYIAVSTTESIIASVQIACDEKNEAGGINGKRVEVLSFQRGKDKKGTREISSDIALRLVEDGRARFVIGHSDSTSSLAAAHIYNRAGIINLIPTGTSPLLNQIGEHIFCLSMNNNFQGKALVSFVKNKLKQDDVILIYQSNEYSKSIAGAFTEEAAKNDLNIIESFWLRDYIEEKELEVLRKVLTLAREKECQNLVILGNDEVVHSTLQEIRNYPDNKVLNVICGDSTEFVTMAEDNVGLLEDISVYSVVNLDISADVAARKAFAKEYRKRTNRKAGSLGYLSYEAALFLFHVLEESQGKGEDVLRLIPEREFNGVTGKFRFLRNGECRRAIYIYSWNNQENVDEIDYYQAR